MKNKIFEKIYTTNGLSFQKRNLYLWLGEQCRFCEKLLTLTTYLRIVMNYFLYKLIFIESNKIIAILSASRGPVNK